MEKKLFGIFDRRPLIWFHYVLLVGILFGGFYLGEYLLNLSELPWWGMFIFWFVILSVGDQLIHSKYILNVD